MIPEYMLEQVFSEDDKRHLAILRLGEIETSTLCGLPSGEVTSRVHPCDCRECRDVAHRPNS